MGKDDSGEELTKDNRMNVKITVEKKFNVAAWEHEVYKIEIEAPYDSLIQAKDMIRLLLPVVKNMRVVTIKAFKGESAEVVVAPVVEVKKEEVKKEIKKDDF